MLRKALWSVVVALFSLSLLIFGVLAQDALAQNATTQDDEDTPAVSLQADAAVANIVQVVPVTLTLSIPSPGGLVTLAVPVYLSLNIRIGLSPNLTTTVQVTPSVATGGELPPVVTVETIEESTAESTAEGNGDGTGDDNGGTVTPTPTIEPTSTPTAEASTPEASTPEASTPAPEAAEPEATEVPLPTATPTETIAPEAAAPLCPDPRAVIVSPGVGQSVSDMVNILGTATHENFQYYKVEYAQGANIDPNDTFSYLADARVQVTGGLLAAFDSTNFANGDYTIKLTVVDNSGNFPPPCTVSVVVQN